MKIAVACDHRGYDGKRKILPLLQQMNHEVKDFGCEGTASVDYPDYAIPAARAVGDGRATWASCSTAAASACRWRPIKSAACAAALVHDEVTARRAREHNHCNVLCLGTDLLSEDQIRQIVEIFLNTPFGDGRHARRIEKLKRFETHDQPLPG